MATPTPLATAPLGRVIFFTVIAALGGLLFGFDTAVINGTTATLKSVFALSDTLLGATVAIGLVGTIVGSLVAGRLGNRFGRKRVLFFVAVLFFVCALGCACAWNWDILVASRFLGGIAVGMASVIAPLYIAEIAPAHLRGRLVGVNQFNVVVGIMVACLSNWVINAQGLPNDQAWRWMLGVQMVPAVVFFVLLFAIKESPRWLVQVGRIEQARQIFASLGERDPAARVAETLESLHNAGQTQEEPLFRRKYALPILATLMIATFNQLSGINALMYYSATIFTMAGAEQSSALLQTVLVSGTNLIFTMVGMCLIDILGRKPLLIVGGIGTGVCLALVAWAFHQQDHSGAKVLIGLLGFIAFFALSQGAVIWVFISEIFPNRVRSKGQALGSMTHWTWATVVSLVFPSFTHTPALTWLIFAFFAVMTLLQSVLVWRLLPETKGYSLEHLQKRLGIS